MLKHPFNHSVGKSNLSDLNCLLGNQGTKKEWTFKIFGLLTAVNYSEKCAFEDLKGRSVNTCGL